jgi:hypothetical protein
MLIHNYNSYIYVHVQAAVNKVIESSVSIKGE